jgi:hypothetical protein
LIGAAGTVPPDWLMMTVCPATVSVPVRALVDEFAATVYATEPVPLPVEPVLTVSHELLLVAVHVQPVGVVTLAVCELAAADGATLVGLTE